VREIHDYGRGLRHGSRRFAIEPIYVVSTKGFDPRAVFCMTAPARIRQADLTRALKAAKAAGFDDVRVDITPAGTLSVLTGKLAETAEPNPWDETPE
jgi:hypothetical protein